MQGFYTILLLVVSNIFMTCAWYGHLKMKQQFSWFEHFAVDRCNLIQLVSRFLRILFSGTGKPNGIQGEWRTVQSDTIESNTGGYYACRIRGFQCDRL